MNQAIEISVIVPNYNYGQYIEECLLSIIESDVDHSTLEIIVVDDASTDNSVDIVNKIIRTADIPIKLILHSGNSGLVKTRNTGIVNAKGKYLFFLDSDDYIRKDCLKKHYDFLKNNSYFTACYAPIQKFNNDTKELLSIISNEPYDYKKPEFGNYIGSIAMIKKEDLVEIGLYDEQMPCNGWEDYELWLRMGISNKKIFFIKEEPLSYYRVNHSSMIKTMPLSNINKLSGYIREKYNLKNDNSTIIAPLLEMILVKVYYSSTNNEFQENKCFYKEIQLKDFPTRVSFNFPPNSEGYNFIRFDLGDKPGFINIHDIELKSKENKILWRWDRSTIDHKEYLFLFQNEELWRDKIVQLATWIDPQFIISTNEAVKKQSSRGISVEVSLSSLTVNQFELINNLTTPFSCIPEKQFKNIQQRNTILENVEEINTQIRQTLKTNELLIEQLGADKQFLSSETNLKNEIINKLFIEKEKNTKAIDVLQQDNIIKEGKINLLETSLSEKRDSNTELQRVNENLNDKLSEEFNKVKLLEEDTLELKQENNELFKIQNKIIGELKNQQSWLEKQLMWYKATYENRKLLGILKDVTLTKIKKTFTKNGIERAARLDSKLQTHPEKEQTTVKSLSNTAGDFLQAGAAFDKEYYLSTYPDVRATKIDPFIHYINQGWREGRTPNKWFNPSSYLEANPDVKELKEKPLTHYLRIGKAEGRSIGKPEGRGIARRSGWNYFDYLNQQNRPKNIQVGTISSKSEYVDFRKHESLETDIKLIAFYLPQYHPIPENDEAWGKGFTEWTNVSKALPQFEGHYQPRLPGELGYYDLRLKDIQKRQIELAKNYGLYGFCYHYYWFAGKKVMDKPLQQLLDNPDLDFPFCINWANENWTKKWDGMDNEVILQQSHSLSDDIDFLEAIQPILMDKRYIKVNNRPLLMIYRPQLFPNIKETVKQWRKHARKIGIGDIYLVLTHAFDSHDPREIGFDAATEFAPNGFPVTNITTSIKTYNPNYNGNVFDYYSAISYSSNGTEPEYTKFRGICPGWDNEARKPGNAHTIHNSSPTLYKRWLEFLCYNTKEHKPVNEQIIFINAWNEWAEGAYLEPDRKYGYANLEATFRVLKKFDKNRLELLKKTQKIRKKSTIAVILHLYYIDLWQEIKNELSNFKEPFDLFITINNNAYIEDIENIQKAYPEAHIYSFENRGRDILPFLRILELILPLGYKCICKLHSKKSLNHIDGDGWRKTLIQGIIGSPEKIKQSIEALNKDNVGIVVEKENLYSYKGWVGSNTELVEKLANKANIKIPEDFLFPAGSIFWFSPKIFKGTEKLLSASEFPIENGQIDGTIAHAYERIVGLLCAVHNCKIECI